MAQLEGSLGQLLATVAYFLERGFRVPSNGLIATHLNLPGRASHIWKSMQKLQESGFISGVPSTRYGHNHRVRILADGYAALGQEPPKPKPIVARVRMFSWRCECCGSVTLNTRDDCVMCRLLATSLKPVVYEPAQGAA